MGVEKLSRAEVFARYGVELTRFAASLVGPSDAQDVVSDALVRSMWSDRWGGVANQRAYLYRSVVSQARMNHRSESRRRDREMRAAPVLDEVGPPDAEVDVWAALGHLSVPERAVTFLIFWEDLTVADAAVRIGVAERTVRRRLKSARRKLGRLLNE